MGATHPEPRPVAIPSPIKEYTRIILIIYTHYVQSNG